MEINKDVIKQLANTLMIDLTTEEIEGALLEFEILETQLEALRAIDTSDVEVMISPFETPTTYLREDEASSVLSIQDVLSNAPSSFQEYFKVVKVVGQDE